MAKAFEVVRKQPHYMAIEWDGQYETIKEIEALSDHLGTDLEFSSCYTGDLEVAAPSKIDRNAKTHTTVAPGEFIVYDSHKEEYSFHSNWSGSFEKMFDRVEA